MPGFSDVFDAVTNIGTRPTVYENHRRTVESHLLDFDADIYGARVELFFYRRLRDEQRFPTIMELTEQIARDVGHARELLAQEPSGEPLALKN